MRGSGSAHRPPHRSPPCLTRRCRGVTWTDGIEDADTPPDDAVSPIADIVAVAEITGPLSPAEVQTLAHYERSLTKGIKTFVEVGQALAVIREQRLYRGATYRPLKTISSQRSDLVARMPIG